MIQLFEKDAKTESRQSSKGNQLKWRCHDIWYKADYTGYEGLSEYLISHLLVKSSLDVGEYVLYETEQIGYRNTVYLGCKSQDFKKDGWELITLERLFYQYYNESLYQSIFKIGDHEKRLRFLVEQTERMTGLRAFGAYMCRLLTLDAFFLNEDRHTHNIAVLVNERQQFAYCPMFDHGAALLSDTTMDYPMGWDEIELTEKVQAKTICASFAEQLEIAESLYGNQLYFSFDKNDVSALLSNEKYYAEEIKKRVYQVILQQIRKYPYLFR